MVKAEFGITNKITGKTRYYLSEINDESDVRRQFEEIVKAGIKNSNDSFFYERRFEDFSYYIEDMG